MTATSIVLVPTLVTPPSDAVVELEDIKRHLRIDDNYSDAILASYVLASVGYLDGWRGVLGRCIMEQEWSVEFEEAGTWRLPFADVLSVAAVDVDDVVMTATLTQDAQGAVVEIEEAGTVTMTIAMPVEEVATVKVIVMLMVERMHDRPIGPADAANVSAVQMLINTVRRMVI